MSAVYPSASLQPYRASQTFTSKLTAYTSEIILRVKRFVINCFETLSYIFQTLYHKTHSLSLKQISASSPVGITNLKSNFCYAIATLQTIINHPFINEYLNEKSYLNCVASLESAQNNSSSGSSDTTPNYYRSVYVFLYEWKQSYQTNTPRQNAEKCLEFKKLIEEHPEYRLNPEAYQDAGGIYEIVLNAMSYSLQKAVEKNYQYKLSDDHSIPSQELVIKKEDSLNIVLLPLHFSDLQQIINYEASTKSYQKGDSGSYNLTIEGKVFEPSQWTESSAIISPPPSLFILQLERCIGTFQSKWIDFPEDLILNLSSLFSCNNAKYRVTGINIYEGAHYYSYIERKGQWFKCNDSMITEVDKKDVEFGKAYFVVLAKVDGTSS